jgi:putative membrane protein
MEFEIYEIVKVFHIVAVISWLAGLLYLPRIFVYHAGVAVGSESDKIFQTMERKLLRYIMNPAMVLAVSFGLYLASEIGFEFVWLHIKLTLVGILAIFHHFLARWRKDFERGTNKHSQKFYRIANEIPTIAMIGIVAMAVLKPF